MGSRAFERGWGCQWALRKRTALLAPLTARHSASPAAVCRLSPSLRGRDTPSIPRSPRPRRRSHVALFNPSLPPPCRFQLATPQPPSLALPTPSRPLCAAHWVYAMTPSNPPPSPLRRSRTECCATFPPSCSSGGRSTSRFPTRSAPSRRTSARCPTEPRTSSWGRGIQTATSRWGPWACGRACCGELKGGGLGGGAKGGRGGAW